MTKNKSKVFSLAAVAIFIAIAYISSLLLPIKVQFLTMDIKDAFITIGALYFGPLSGVVISLAVSLLELLFGSDTGLYGFIMNFLGSATFAAVAALIYTRKKSIINAVTALFCACISMTVIMLAANLIVTPYFMASRGMDRQTIEQMIVPLFLPFNLFKGLLNAAIVMLIYKPISVALKKTGLFGEKSASVKVNKNTIVFSLVAVAILIASLIFIFVKLNGELSVESIKTDLGPELYTFFISIIPIIELRGAIPVGQAMGLNFFECFFFAVLGNMLPVPFILLFIRQILAWMKGVKHLDKIALWLEKKAHKNAGKVTKYATWGLFLFVAVPLPGTGAWTGSLIAALLGMPMKKTLPSVCGGVIVAGLIVSGISFGFLSFLDFLL